MGAKQYGDKTVKGQNSVGTGASPVKALGEARPHAARALAPAKAALSLGDVCQL
jgi:hypothetical protein